MSEDAKSVVAAREIYTACLQDFLSGPVMVGFASLYEAAKADTPEGRTPLRQFQIALSETPSWNQSRIDAEVKRICRDSSESYLEDLITTILVSNAEILSSINLHGKTNKIQLKIPKIGNFVHAVYVCVARRLYKEIYVFDEDAKAAEKQRNMRRCEEIVRDAILTVLQDNLPIHDIIRQYVTGGGDAREAIDEVSDLLEDPDVIPAEISPESVSIVEEDAEPQDGGEATPSDDPEDPTESVQGEADDVSPIVPTGDDTDETSLEGVSPDVGALDYPVDSMGRVDMQIGSKDEDEGPESDAGEDPASDEQDGGELVPMELPESNEPSQVSRHEEDENKKDGSVPEESQGDDDASGSIVIDISDIVGAEDPDDNDTGDHDSEDAANGSDEEIREATGGGGRHETITGETPKMIISPKELDAVADVELSGGTKGTDKGEDGNGDHEGTDPSNAGTDNVDPISDGEFDEYDFTDDELMSDRDDMGELIERIKTGNLDGPSKAEIFLGDLVPKKKMTETDRGRDSMDTKSKRTSVSSGASSDGGVTDGDSKRFIFADSLDPEASDDRAVKRRRRRAKKRVQLFPDAKSDTGAED
ncbi:g731 [Coccomyxa elongata]